MIIVLFGQPGSGKTTLASNLKNWKVIDGDLLRTIFSNSNYSKEGRIINLNRASDIGHYLSSTGENVVIAMIYPYKECRDYLNSLNKDVKWVHLIYEGERGKEKFHVKEFDFPIDESTITINTSYNTIEQCIEIINQQVDSNSKKTYS